MPIRTGISIHVFRQIQFYHCQQSRTQTVQVIQVKSKDFVEWTQVEKVVEATLEKQNEANDDDLEHEYDLIKTYYEDQVNYYTVKQQTTKIAIKRLLWCQTNMLVIVRLFISSRLTSVNVMKMKKTKLIITSTTNSAKNLKKLGH